jgi:ribosome maturation factor RimP
MKGGDKMIEKIKTASLSVVEKYSKILCSVEKVNEYGIDIVRITIDDPSTFDMDIDVVAAINEEILDLVNDDLPDGYYLEVTSVGVERELKTNDDLEKGKGKYIYLSTYEKIVDAFNQKEMYGYLDSYDDETVAINVINKTKTKLVKIEKAKIAKLRLAVKF